MKKLSIIAVLLVVITVLTAIPVSAFGTGTVLDDYEFSRVEAIRPEVSRNEETSKSAPFDSGSGTNKDPYIIKTEDHLLSLASGYYGDSFVKLGADIKIKTKDWTPLSSFNGEFDGDGHVISGLKSTQGGLFTYLNYATIKNLGLEGVKIEVEAEEDYLGAFASKASNAEFSNCYVSGTIKSKGKDFHYVGGFVGYSPSSVFKDCLNKATVDGNGPQCGFSVMAAQTEFYRCVNLGNTNGGMSFSGGATGVFKDCYYLESKGGHNGSGATAITAGDLKKQETFNNFDFDKIWKISGGKIDLAIAKAEEEEDDESKGGLEIDWMLIIGIALGVIGLIVVAAVAIVVVKKIGNKKSEPQPKQAEPINLDQILIDQMNVAQSKPVTPEPIEPEPVQPEPVQPEIVAEPQAVEEQPAVIEQIEEAENAEVQNEPEVIAEPEVTNEPETQEEPKENFAPKFCVKCGSPVIPGAKFCNVCGNNLYK